MSFGSRPFDPQPPKKPKKASKKKLDEVKE